VGNLIRRAKVKRENGYTELSHPYQSQQKEFIASTDATFRPVWTESAPDGSLMILDMYRGIIQEGNWTKEGSYLRGVIDEYGFDKIIGRGRLYRVKKENVPLTKLPQMYAQSSEQLIKHLSHKNRWWRLEAQKLMVLSGNKKLVPALKKLAVDHKQPLAQIHALWTLEGLGVVDKTILTRLFNSKNSDVRVTAIRISEPLVSAGDKSITDKWLTLASDSDVEVAQQAILSAYYVTTENSEAILAAVKKQHSDKKGVKAIENAMQALVIHAQKRAKLATLNQDLAAAMIAGEKAYKSLCYTCHGSDGRGTPAGNNLIAPSLHNNPRVIGNTASLINLVLHGMHGEIDGVNYVGGMMPSIASNGDEYVANVLSYVRNDFNNQASIIRAEEVSAVTKMDYAPDGMWTQATLDNTFAKELPQKSEWKITTNFPVHPKLNIEKLNDNLFERPFFSSKGKREKGHAITIELPALAIISEVVLDSSILPKDYSRHYTIEFSIDGSDWFTVIDNPTAVEVNREQTLGHKAKFVRITNQIGGVKRPWRIQEITMFGSYQ
jgi:mono/diheme cytochrome c family protein